MKLCEIDDCGEQGRIKGMCKKHYERVRRYGRLHLVRSGNYFTGPSPRPVRKCDLYGCPEKHYAKGLCRTHWKHARRIQEIPLEAQPRHLPSAPLLPLVKAFLPAMNADPIDTADEELAKALSTFSRSFSRGGSIHFATADTICCAMRLHPSLVWPEQWIEFEKESVCEAA